MIEAVLGGALTMFFTLSGLCLFDWLHERQGGVVR